MTIVAGFVNKDGVLLCADTQLEVSGSRLHGMKLGCWRGDWGTMGAAFAGHAYFAVGAIQKCVRELNRECPDTHENLISIIEASLERHYQNVNPGSGAYQLLLSVRGCSDEFARLFGTFDSSIREIATGYACEGIGLDLAHYFIRPMFNSSEWGERETLAFAAYVLANVKQSIPGCGGQSLFLSLRNDGTMVQFHNDPAAAQIENVCRDFDMLARKVLLSHVHLETSDEQFDRRLEEFMTAARAIRAHWNGIRTQEAAAEMLAKPVVSPCLGSSRRLLGNTET